MSRFWTDSGLMLYSETKAVFFVFWFVIQIGDNSVLAHSEKIV